MPREDILPCDPATRHGSCSDGTKDGEDSEVDRQAGMRVGTRPEVVRLRPGPAVHDFDHTSADMSDQVLGSEVEISLSDLARLLAVYADSIDVLQHDYQAAKYSIACDCVARGTVKDKRDCKPLRGQGQGEVGEMAKW